MNYRILALVALVTIVGLVGYVLGNRAQRPTQDRRSASSSEPRDLTADNDLRSAVGRLEQRLSVLEARGPASTQPTAPSEGANRSPARPTHRELIEDSIRQAAEVSEEIAGRLKTEGRDRVWSSAAEESIRGAMKSAMTDGGTFAFTNLTCVTSLCEADVSLPSLTGPSSAVYDFPFRVPNMGGFRKTHPTQNADGTYTIQYTFFRKGFPIPGGDAPNP